VNMESPQIISLHKNVRAHVWVLKHVCHCLRECVCECEDV
jgi:hypothetical protein